MIELFTTIYFAGGAGKVLRSANMQSVYTLLLQRLYYGFKDELQKAKDKKEIDNFMIGFTDEGYGLEIHIYSNDMKVIEKEKKFVDAVQNNWKTKYTFKMAGLSFKSEIIGG